MRYELRSIGLWSFIKVSFFINLPFGFMLGLLYTVTLPFMFAGMGEFGLGGPVIDPDDFPFGVMLIVLPLMGALFAAVVLTLGGVVLVGFYNIIRRLIGGLELELEPETIDLSVKSTGTQSNDTVQLQADKPVSPVESTAKDTSKPPPPPPIEGVNRFSTDSSGSTELQTTTPPASGKKVVPVEKKDENAGSAVSDPAKEKSKMKSQPEVRVRIAPSPSGYVHVGTARTAIFNYMFARHYGGKFLVRIENTDEERSDPSFIDAILSAMKWLGLEWDEDIIYQADRCDLYRKYVDELVKSGHGYPCFCTPEVLAADREKAKAEKGDMRYNRRCLNLSADEIAVRKTAGEPFVVRLRIPEGECRFDDLVSGELSRSSNDIEDFIVARSDGSATYNLAVVVDDHLMGITHVIRGNDHITNTFKQIHLYRALGFEVPQFGHVPMILRTDKKKVSKRLGDKDVLQYRNEGILPEAMFNYLCLLGWSPKTDREIYSVDELIAMFTPDNFNPSNAVFDEEKLIAFNQEYIAGKSDHDLAVMVAPLLVEAGLTTKYWLETRWDYLRRVIGALKLRARKIVDFVELSSYFFTSDFKYDPEAAAKQFTPENKPLLDALADRFESLESFTAASIEQCLAALAEGKGLKRGKLIHPTRLAVSGRTAGPSLYEMLEILSQPIVVERLRRASAQIDLTNNP